VLEAKVVVQTGSLMLMNDIDSRTSVNLPPANPKLGITNGIALTLPLMSTTRRMSCTSPDSSKPCCIRMPFRGL